MKKLIFYAPVVLVFLISSCGSGEEKKSDTDTLAKVPDTIAAPPPVAAPAVITVPDHVITAVSNAKSITKKKQHHSEKKKVKKADNTEVEIVETITILELVPSEEAPANAPAKGTKEADHPKDAEGYYYYPTVKPGFPGGEKALDAYLEKNLKYPAAALDNGIEGTVLVRFAVDETGKVYPPKVISNPLGRGLEEEALKVVSGMPAWKPGTIDGKNVKSRFTLPIKFDLQN